MRKTGKSPVGIGNGTGTVLVSDTEKLVLAKDRLVKLDLAVRIVNFELDLLSFLAWYFRRRFVSQNPRLQRSEVSP